MNEEYSSNLKEGLEEVLLKKIQKLDSMTEGTKEHSMLADDIQKLYKQWSEERKADIEEYYRRKELQVKHRQIEMESKKYRRVKPDTVLLCGTVIGLTVGCCYFEAKGHIFPTKMLKFADKLKFSII